MPDRWELGFIRRNRRYTTLWLEACSASQRTLGRISSGEKGTAISCPIANKTAFFYSEFGCIVEFIRSSYGAQRYQAFLKDVVEGHPLNVERSFEKVYGTKLGDEIARFKNETKKH